MSEHHAPPVPARRGLRLADAEVAHPGVDPGFFAPGEEHEWAWRLLYVGRLDERKGVDAAVEALAHLPEEATLTVLGSGDDRFLAELRDARATTSASRSGCEFGLRPRDELPPPTPPPTRCSSRSRWEEPWGLVPLEAMAVGTPVVATGTGGSAEFLRDERERARRGPRRDARDAGAAPCSGSRPSPSCAAACARAAWRPAARHTEAGYNARIAAALASAAATP